MYFVYILVDKNGKRYIGCTENIERRIKEHRSDRTITTKFFQDLKLYYYEAHTLEEKAFEREKKLKQYGSAYQWLIKRIGLK